MSRLICGENLSFSMDCFETQLTNNLLVIGATGTGKSRSIIGPNIMECYGSSIIFDPKGALYKQYADILRSKGYKIQKLDFTNPQNSCHYNPLQNISTTQDVMNVAHSLVYTHKGDKCPDPFWDESMKLFLSSIIAYVCAEYDESRINMQSVIRLVRLMKCDGDYDETKTPLDIRFQRMRKRRTEMGRFARSCYEQVRNSADKTLASILVYTSSRLAPYGTKEVMDLTSMNDFDIRDIANEKTAFFVICSDYKAASMENIVQLFFSQMMDQLVEYADNDCLEQRLPIPVQFIMDDFACGVSIADFHKKIAIVRSRNISVCVVLQAINQLEDMYGSPAAKTIISNFDTTVFMGTNDIDTCKEISQRINKPLNHVLYMPVGYSWVFRRGEQPKYVKNAKPIDLREMISSYKDLKELRRSNMKTDKYSLEIA